MDVKNVISVNLFDNDVVRLLNLINKFSKQQAPKKFKDDENSQIANIRGFGYKLIC